MVAQSLASSIAAHPDCDVAPWRPRRLCDILEFRVATKRLDEDIEPIDKKAAIGLDQPSSLIESDVAKERDRGIHTLISSEENFTGGMRNNFQTGVVYPDVAHRLASFDSLLPLSPMRMPLGGFGPMKTS